MLSINLNYADKRQPILDDIAPTVTVSHTLRLQRIVREHSLLSQPSQTLQCGSSKHSHELCQNQDVH